MPSADQVPVKSSHSTMQWHLWVVLIAGATGSALRAVRPPNLHITPDDSQRDLYYAASATGSLYRSPLAIMAQAILAILLASAAKALSNSSLLLILIGWIAVPVASPPNWICSRKGLEKGSVALARAVTRRADGSMSRINWTHLPDSSAVTLAMPVTFPPGR